MSEATMLSHTCRRILCGAAFAALAACGGTTTEQVISPTAVRCQIGLNGPAGAIPSAGSSVSVNITAARDCTWSAATDAPWLTVTPTSGQGAAAVMVTAAVNVQPSARSAAIVVNETSITLRQEPAPCRFELGHQSTRVAPEGERTLVRVMTTDLCEWRTAGGNDWVRILTSGGVGAGTVDLDVTRNTGVERSATLTIAGLPFFVLQPAVSTGPDSPGGGPGSPGPSDPPAPSCSYAIDPERATVRAAAGQGSVRVITASGCSWNASSGASWISVPRGSGTGPESVTYQVSANTSTVSERSGTVAVAGRTHRVTQQACELTLEPGTPGFGPNGGNSHFAVTTDAGCTWSASSDVDWIVITRSSGSGSGEVTYTVAPNPIERDRSGRITVSGRTKQVIQQALGQGG